MFTYTLKGKDLTKDEAVALAQATSTSPIKIELSSLLNLRKADSAKLFRLSVEKKMPELANLAWKISVDNDSIAPVKKEPTSDILTIQKPVDKLLADLHQSTGLWTTGAAMILASASNGSWWTLRQIAVYWANNLDVSSKSILFQGFELVDGVWEPKDLRVGIPRRQTFHVSPVYIALRDALKWLLEKDLIKRTQSVSKGSYEGNVSPQVNAMSRVFYSVQLTERGKQMVELWGDVEEFIQNSFKNRVR